MPWRGGHAITYRMQGWFITATDTGVGKTHVAAALCAALKKTGHAVLPVKPVQTGSRDGRSEDLDLVLGAMGHPVSPEVYARLAPFRFALPASPHLAARTAETEVSVAALAAAVREAAALAEILVVEGAGGVRAPVNDREDMLDLMAALGLPVIVAARPGLGTLNHTRLTLDAVRGAGLTVAAVALTPWPENPGPIETDNRTRIAAWAHPAPCVLLPVMATSSPSTWIHEGRRLYEAVH